MARRKTAQATIKVWVRDLVEYDYEQEDHRITLAEGMDDQEAYDKASDLSSEAIRSGSERYYRAENLRQIDQQVKITIPDEGRDSPHDLAECRKLELYAGKRGK